MNWGNPQLLRPPAYQEQRDYVRQQLQNFTLSGGQGSLLPPQDRFHQQPQHEHCHQQEPQHRFHYQRIPQQQLQQQHHQLQHQQQQQQWQQQQRQYQEPLQQQQQHQQQYQLQYPKPQSLGHLQPQEFLPPRTVAANPYLKPVRYPSSEMFPSNAPFSPPLPASFPSNAPFSPPPQTSLHTHPSRLPGAVPPGTINPRANVTEPRARNFGQSDFAKHQTQTYTFRDGLGEHLNSALQQCQLEEREVRKQSRDKQGLTRSECLSRSNFPLQSLGSKDGAHDCFNAHDGPNRRCRTPDDCSTVLYRAQDSENKHKKEQGGFNPHSRGQGGSNPHSRKQGGSNPHSRKQGDSNAHSREDDSSSAKIKTSGSTCKRQRRTTSKCDSSTRGHSDNVVSTAAEDDNKKERQRLLAKELFDKEMLQKTTEMFPSLLTTTTHFPPQHFNKTSTKWDEVRGLHVQCQSNPSDTGSERAEKDVIRCLETIRKLTGEPMCIISNYPFDNYLEKRFTPLPKKQKRSDPLPRDKSSPAIPYVRLKSATTDLDNSVVMSPMANFKSYAVVTAKSSTLSSDQSCVVNSENENGSSVGPCCTTREESASAWTVLDSAARTGITDTGTEGEEPASYSGQMTDVCLSANDSDSRLPTPVSSHRVHPDSPSLNRDPRKQFPRPIFLFPNPGDLGKDLKRGDFDVLVLSQSHGCIVMETKAVGYAEQVDLAAVRKKLERAVKQLCKEETVLRHLFGDLMEALPVRKVVAMPNISREVLKSACAGGDGFEQVVCDCFSANSMEEAAGKTLCADDIVKEDPTASKTGGGDAPPHEALLRWWKNVTKGDNSVISREVGRERQIAELEQKLPQRVFEQIVARLSGPYSKVTVESTRGAAEARTVADCVHLTGLRYGRPLLRSDQLDVLDSQDHFVYLTGPPGSGKTLVLGLKGVQWANRGDHVVVVVPRGVGWGSLVSQTLYRRIREFSRKSPFSTTQQHNKQKSTSSTNETKERSTLNRDDRTPNTTLRPPYQTLTHEDTTSEIDSSNTPTHDSQTNPRSRNSLPLGHSSDKPLLSEQDEDGAPNVHKATVQTTEDTEQFVRDLLARYGDRPLRVIVDEGPIKVNVQYLHRILAGALKKLNNAKECLESLLGGCSGCGKSGSSWCELHFQPSDSSGSKREGDTGVAKALLEKVQHHLDTISERLHILQPPHRRPLVTQSAEWKNVVTGIASLHRDVSHCLVSVHERLPSPPDSARLFGPFRSVTETHDPLCRPSKVDPASLSGHSRTVTGNHELSASGGIVSDCGQAYRVSRRPRENDETERREKRCDLLSAATSESRFSEEVGHCVSRGREQATDASPDTPQSPEDQTKPGDDESLETDKVIAVLDKLEADMLDVSGKLFNVETQMDFFVLSEVFSLLVKERISREVSVWSSGMSPFYQPENFVHKTMTHCLRCPPTVQRVLGMVEKDMQECPNYRYKTDSLSDDHYPLHTDGPEVKLLDHGSHLTKVKDILDCPQCGEMLADYLLRTLRIGGDSGLRVDDVVISGSLDISNVQGRPLLQALLDQGIQVQFEQQGLTSPPPYPGKMFVIGGCSLQGLEAKVVVFIPDVSRISNVTGDVKEFRPELPAWLRNMGRWNRCHLWFIASRCLSQLVAFHV